MAALVGSPPVSWRAWRPSEFPPTATAFATITDCSAKSSRTVGSRNTLRNGCPSAIHGSSRGRHVNPLRLWSARAVDPLRLDAFNMGDHVGALSEQTRAEAISKILYPSDATPAGLELRLRQEYFFVSASLLDLVQRHLRTDGNLYFLPLRAAIQLNDTHPSIAVPELMRILVDLHRLPWHEAWRITVGTFSYTNHTLLPEALETWPIDLFGRVLPRHLEIIYRINTEHLAAAATDPSASDSLESISLI